jgi:hypothetical protein
MIHLMTERTFVLTVRVVSGTFELMMIIVHALCAVFHLSRVIARLAINSSLHESVGVPGGHGAVPIRTVRPVGCPTLPVVGIVSRGLCPVRGFRLWSVGKTSVCFCLLMES